MKCVVQSRSWSKRDFLHSSETRNLSLITEEKDGPLFLSFLTSPNTEPLLWFAAQKNALKNKSFSKFYPYPLKNTPFTGFQRIEESCLCIRMMKLFNFLIVNLFSHSQCWNQQHSTLTLIRPLKERERALFCTRGVEGSCPGVRVTDCLLN